MPVGIGSESSETRKLLGSQTLTWRFDEEIASARHSLIEKTEVRGSRSAGLTNTVESADSDGNDSDKQEIMTELGLPMTVVMRERIIPAIFGPAGLGDTGLRRRGFRLALILPGRKWQSRPDHA